MAVRAGRPLVVETVGRPKSSLAQIVTAAAAVIALVVIAGAALLTVTAAQNADAARRATVATVQSYCLNYMEYVLGEYRAGLSVEQIDATLRLAAQAGERMPAQGVRLDDPQVCGNASRVLHTAGLK